MPPIVKEDRRQEVACKLTEENLKRLQTSFERVEEAEVWKKYGVKRTESEDNFQMFKKHLEVARWIDNVDDVLPSRSVGSKGYQGVTGDMEMGQKTKKMDRDLEEYRKESSANPRSFL